MRRIKAISVLIALSLILLAIPSVKAPVDEWVTGTVDEDLFFAAYLFEGVDMVYLQGDGMRILGYYWFEGPIMQAGRYIKEAYLEVTTPTIGATDTDASMMIYGKPSGSGGTPSYAEDPNVVNGPYTTNSYQVNLSSFVGVGVKHNITVTRILREINQGYYYWDGHDIAFVTIAHDGHDEERSIASLEAGYPATLYIHYGVPEPGDPEYPSWLPPDGEFVEDYRNTTIWRVEYYDDAIMSIYARDRDNAHDFYYGDYDALRADPSDVVFVADNGNEIEYAHKDTIVRVNETIVIMEDPGQVTMHVSNDLGDTWTSHILNDEYTNLAAHATSACGSMSLDENGTVHMIWNTFTDTSPAAMVGVYSNFTVLNNGTIDYYDGFDEFLIFKSYNNVEVDEHGRVHSGYVTGGDIYYTYRRTNDTWSAPRLIENQDTLTEVNLDIASHSNSTREPVVRFVYFRGWVGNEYIYQTILESDFTLTDTALSSNNAFDACSAMWVSGNKSIAAYQDNPGAATPEIEFRIFNFTTMTLSPVQYATSTAQQHHDPDIGIDEELNNLYFIWRNQWSGDLMYGRIYNLTSDTFLEGQQDLTSTIDIERAQIIPWGIGEVGYTDWFVADMNGTLIGNTTTQGTGNITDIEDWIDTDLIGYPDPEDPDPPGWGEGWVTAQRFKFIMFLIGLILFVGSPIYGFAERPEAATWIILMFLSLCGVALLWSLQTM